MLHHCCSLYSDDSTFHVLVLIAVLYARSAPSQHITVHKYLVERFLHSFPVVL